MNSNCEYKSQEEGLIYTEIPRWMILDPSLRIIGVSKQTKSLKHLFLIFCEWDLLKAICSYFTSHYDKQWGEVLETTSLIKHLLVVYEQIIHRIESWSIFNQYTLILQAKDIGFLICQWAHSQPISSLPSYINLLDRAKDVRDSRD